MLIIRNGEVYELDKDRPKVDAMAVFIQPRKITLTAMSPEIKAKLYLKAIKEMWN